MKYDFNNYIIVVGFKCVKVKIVYRGIKLYFDITNSKWTWITYKKLLLYLMFATSNRFS